MNRSRNMFVALAAIGLVAAPSAARGDGITVTGSSSTSGFVAVPTNFSSSFGTPFWNGKSTDTVNGHSDGKANIGYYLTGTGDFTGGFDKNPGIPVSSLSDFLEKNGSADPTENFSTSGGVAADLSISIAANSAADVFGWYADGTFHPLFSGTGSGSVLFIPPSTGFEFYLQTPYGIFFSDASQNVNSSDKSAYTTEQHFAVFQQSNGTLWLGVEDQPFSISDKDYNDVVVSLTAVPEPTGLVTLCLGGLVLGTYRLTRRRLALA